MGIVALSLLMAVAPAAADHIGRIYSYVRSDRDGAEAETIHIFRQSRTHIGVAKMRGRCTNAAYVTADLDLEHGYATRLGGGRLRPNAQREEFAVLTYDEAAGGWTAASRPRTARSC